jgi:hypothetical protein
MLKIKNKDIDMKIIKKYWNILRSRIENLDKIKYFLDKHFFWINPVLILLTTLESALFTYSPSHNWINQHPIKYDLLSYFLGNLKLLICLALLLTLLNVFNFFRNKSINQLDKKIENYESILKTITENIRSLFDGFLYKFATKKLNVTDKDRISLYIYDENEKKFILFGRYAVNPKYIKSNRKYYIDNNGCISKSLESKWHFDNKFPKNEKDWINYNNSIYNISKNEAKKMKMKSKLYAALRIDNRNKILAVILFESLDSEKFNENKIKKILEDQENYLEETISALELYIPKPSKVKDIEEL